MGKLCNGQDIFLTGSGTKSRRDSYDEPRGRGDRYGGEGGRGRSYSDDAYKSFGGGRSKGKGRDYDDRDYGRSRKGDDRGRKGDGRSRKGDGERKGKGGGGKGRKRNEPEPSQENLDQALEEYFTGVPAAKKAKTEGGEKTKGGEKKKDGKTEEALDNELDKYMGDNKDEFTSKDKSHSEGILKEKDEEEKKEE